MKKKKHSDVILQITTAIRKLSQQSTMMYKMKHKNFYILKPNTKFSKFGWTAKTCKNVISHVIRCIYVQYVKLG